MFTVLPYMLFWLMLVGCACLTIGIGLAIIFVDLMKSLFVRSRSYP